MFEVIKLYVYGIINPNYVQNDNTGWIKVSIKDGDFLINHNEEAGILVTSEAPEINNVF